MEVRDLPLPERYVEHYLAAGVETLYPGQAAAVEAGILEGASVVAAIPTASGKTMIAELAMLSATERGGRALYVVPLRALAGEKRDAFAALPGIDVGVAIGDYDADADTLADHDVIIATSEKVDSLVRSGDSWLADVTCVVVDEIHLIDDVSRGPTLEVTLAKLRRLQPACQLVGLSATVANADDLASWLDATPVESDWRPVELRTGAFGDGCVHFGDGSTRRIAGAGDDPTATLVGETIAESGQCLVFVHSRRAAESLAADLGPIGFGGSGGATDGITETATTDTGRLLADCAAGGVAFHHAGLRHEHRTAVERAFRAGDLEALCATPTLAAGVNVPARRVVVRDLHRYTDRGREPLSVTEVRQMCGRAGRPGLDPEGEAVLVGDGDDPQAIIDRYVRADPEPVTSALASQDALRTHVLATVASGFAGSRAELLDVLSGTFYAHEAPAGGLRDVADLVLDALASAGMLADADGLVASPFGETVSRSYVDPLTGVQIRDGLRAAADVPAPDDITALELICTTPDMSSFYLRDTDRARVYRFAEAHEDALLSSLSDFEGDFGAWLADLKTAVVLLEVVAGVSADTITARYGIGPGDLRTKRERAVWLLSAAGSIAERLEVTGAIHEPIVSVRRRLENRED